MNIVFLVKHLNEYHRQAIMADGIRVRFIEDKSVRNALIGNRIDMLVIVDRTVGELPEEIRHNILPIIKSASNSSIRTIRTK